MGVVGWMRGRWRLGGEGLGWGVEWVLGERGKPAASRGTMNADMPDICILYICVRGRGVRVARGWGVG